jgi:hypothetical protein
MAAFGATAPISGTVKKPINGDPALRRRGSAAETSMTTEARLPPGNTHRGIRNALIGQKRPLKPKDV